MPALAVVLSATLAAGDPCDLPARAADACRQRLGHCFDVTIDGQRVVPLADAALRATLAEAMGHPVCWALPQPVIGELVTEASANAHTGQLGEPNAPLELVVTGLEGQSIPTRKGVRTDPTVHIGGMPMQTVVDVIDTAALPPGAYVVLVRYVGTRGWDRKAIHLTVN